MKIIILGCGRVGSTLANMLSDEGHEVSIIDQNTDSFRRLNKNFKGKKISGFGIDLEILKKAGIEDADTFISTTTGDNTSIMAAQMAKEIFKIKKVVARIYDPIRAAFYKEMGIETYCPTMVGSLLIKNTIIGKEPDIEKIREMLGFSCEVKKEE